MKCSLCNKGNLERIKDFIEEDNIEFAAYKCQSCKEEIMNMKQLKTLSESID